ncbi:MAG TPA: rhodanese-like domain-containing protein [Solirubrobacteraceae bacterium]|nr:rhodanese-like domain-containing protein [Solirubrobacteraceae bacterium]
MLLARKIERLSPAEAWEAHRRNELVLVDVREQRELRSGVASGALQIPLRELSRRIGELPGRGPAAFICRSGHRSLLAARTARGRGIGVASVEGGMIAWNEAGLPISAPAGHDR